MTSCWEYTGIVKWWIDLSETDRATWIAAIGAIVGAIATAGAAIVAAMVYKGTVSREREKIANRRSICLAILKPNIVQAARIVSHLSHLIEENQNSFQFQDANAWPALKALLTIDGVERMAELQSELFGFDDKDDKVIAVFIEKCRLYQVELEDCSMNATSVLRGTHLVGFETLLEAAKSAERSVAYVLRVVMPAPAV